MENETKEASKVLGGKKIFIIISLIVAVIAIAVAIIFIISTKKEDNETMYVIDTENYQQIKDDMDTQVAEGYFETYMNTTWTFVDGKSASKDAIFGNSPNNSKVIRVVVTLDDLGETVYTSGLLPVGAMLPSIELEKNLSAGTYPATCMIYLMDQESGKYVEYSNAGFAINIIIEN